MNLINNFAVATSPWYITYAFMLPLLILSGVTVFLIGRSLNDRMISRFGIAMLPLAVGLFFKATTDPTGLMLHYYNTITFLKLLCVNAFSWLLLLAAFNGELEAPLVVRNPRELFECFKHKKGIFACLEQSLFSTPGVLGIFAMTTAIAGAFFHRPGDVAVVWPTYLMAFIASVWAGLKRIEYAIEYKGAKGKLGSAIVFMISICIMTGMLVVRATTVYIESVSSVPLTWIMVALIGSLDVSLILMAAQRNSWELNFWKDLASSGKRHPIIPRFLQERHSSITGTIPKH